MGAILIVYSFVRKGQQDKGEKAEATATAAATTLSQQRVSPPPSTAAAQAAESAMVSRVPAPPEAPSDRT
jgi:hypothetical protein